MSLKKKVKIKGEEVDVVEIEAPIKCKAELQKNEGNLEGILEFTEKFGGRYEIRMKLDKTFSDFLTQVYIPLPFPTEKELQLNLMKVLGFSHLHFYINTIISNNYSILFYLIDSLIEYDLKRNMEIVKLEGNIPNGIIGLKRDANLQSLVFFHSYEDMREVLFGC
jgi:hypothetical protein